MTEAAAMVAMVTARTSVNRRSGVSYVTVRLDNRIETPVVNAHAVELTATVTPIWTTSAADRPGWEDGVTTVEVPVGTVRGVGFATPEPCDESAIEVTAVGPANGLEDETATPAPETVLRALGDPRPPRSAVPVPDGREPACDRQEHESPTTAAHSTASGSNDEGDSRTGTAATQSADDPPEPPPIAESTLTSERTPTEPTGRAPAPVEKWLASVEKRTAGGEPAARAADRVHLRRVQRQIETLLEQHQ